MLKERLTRVRVTVTSRSILYHLGDKMDMSTYMEQRQQAYQERGRKEALSAIETRKLQTLPGGRGYTIGFPRRYVKYLGLHEHDLIRLQLTDNGIVTMKKIELH